MSRLRIGLVGLGAVGAALLRAAREQPELHIIAICARDQTRERGLDLSGYEWESDPIALAQRDDIDVFVELMGGAGDPAKAAVLAALSAGKPVVTANKALLAQHGAALAALGAPLLFEAAIAGAVPIVRSLQQALAGAHIQSIAGILNGTCNYLLSEMEAAELSFETALLLAQKMGFAEADPTADVGGFDAAHKIAILAALAFGGAPDFDAIAITGITQISGLDIRLAGKLGYRIRLIARAERGRAPQVRPALVAHAHPLAAITGPTNSVVVEAEKVGRLTFTGPGAGGEPTAAAVLGDLLDLARNGRQRPPLFAGAGPIIAAATTEPQERFFLRLLVKEGPGVIAAISNALADHAISIESFLQDPAPAEGLVPLVLTTQAIAPAIMQRAVAAIAALPAIAEPPHLLPIEERAREPKLRI